MTKELAIKILTGEVLGTSEQTHEAVTMAVRALLQPEIVRCEACKHWRRAVVYGLQLSCGHCESDEMWQSLYGETYEVAHIDTEENYYCGYGERKDDE